MARNHFRYTERHLVIDGVRYAAGLAALICVLAALRGA